MERSKAGTKQKQVPTIYHKLIKEKLPCFSICAIAYIFKELLKSGGGG